MNLFYHNAFFDQMPPNLLDPFAVGSCVVKVGYFVCEGYAFSSKNASLF